MYAQTECDYIKNYLGPKLSKSHPDMKLLMYDHNKDHVVTWTKTVYGDSEAAQYMWGTAVHWYSRDQFDNLNTLYPDKPPRLPSTERKILSHHCGMLVSTIATISLAT